METILILTGVILLLLLADLILSAVEKAERGKRMQRDNEELIRTVRAQQSRIRRLENRVRTGNWTVTSETERRCAELELELQQAKKKLEIKDAMLRAMLPAERKSENEGGKNQSA